MKYIISLLVFMACAAHAQVTLTYQSAGFPPAENAGIGTIPCPNALETFACLIFSITVAALPPNMDNELVEVTALNSISYNNVPLTASDGVTPAKISSPDPGLLIDFNCYLSTDSTGKITGWNFTIASVLSGNVIAFAGMTPWDYAFTAPPNGGVWTSHGPGTWTQPAPPAPIVTPPPASAAKILQCSPSKVVAPSATIVANVSPSISGSPSECKEVGAVPSSWYVKTTVDSGHSWQWQSTIAQLGL